MSLIESIGWLALLLLAGYLLLMYLSNKDDSARQRGILIANNDKCQDLIRAYNRAGEAGKRTMTQMELQKKLDQILADPKEVELALAKIKRKADQEEEFKQERRDERKLGYKYEIEIFEIFDTDRELSKHKLLEQIISKFNIDLEGAIRLLELWTKNRLVTNCSWNNQNFEVGHVLISDIYSLDKTDLTRHKWLVQQGKTLKPESREYLDYMRSSDLPF